MMQDPRKQLRNAQRIVVKIGSSVLNDEHKGTVRLGIGTVNALAADIADAIGTTPEKQLLIVSSGAVAAGLDHIGATARPSDLATLQAAAAAGQPLLMRAWSEAFASRSRVVGQMLLTRDVFDQRDRYLNARACIESLLSRGIIPVINENDSVATDEITLGDNDLLAARLTVALDAHALILLSSAPGVRNELGTVEPTLPSAESIRRLATDESSSLGSGGMRSKADAARDCTRGSAVCVIASGRENRIVTRLLQGETLGTAVPAAPAHGPAARKRWLGAAATPAGAIVIDDGAAHAITNAGASLLAKGCLETRGDFEVGAVVSIEARNGNEIARGLVTHPAAELSQILGLDSDAAARKLNHPTFREVVHRDNMAVFSTGRDTPTPPAPPH